MSQQQDRHVPLSLGDTPAHGNRSERAGLCAE